MLAIAARLMVDGITDGIPRQNGRIGDRVARPLRLTRRSGRDRPSVDA